MLVGVKLESYRFVGAIIVLLIGAVAASQPSEEAHGANKTNITATQPSNEHPAPANSNNSTHPLDKPVNVIPENHPSGRHISSPKEKAPSVHSSVTPPPEAPSSTSNPRRRKPPDAGHPAPLADERVIASPQADNVVFDVVHPKHPDLRTGKFNPTFAAIVAAICITTAVGGYIMLMTWRRVEMERYGNRQILLNEDDFGDIQDEDMRHFEASCIQIEA